LESLEDDTNIPIEQIAQFLHFFANMTKMKV